MEVALGSKEIQELKKPFKGRYWKVEGLAVDPSALNQGISRVLMEAMFHLADVKSTEQAPCVVGCGLEKLSPLYKKLGFVDGEVQKEIAVKGDPGGVFMLCSLVRKSGSGAGGGGGAAGAKSSQVAPSSE